MPSRREPPKADQTHRLPAERTSFVGRENLMALAHRLMKASRLLTLTGPGGVGKTRIALRLAHDHSRDFDRVVWVDLTAQHTPELLDTAVAAALDVRDQSARPAREALLDHLRGRTVLLVLDNCEHLVDQVASLVDALLRDAPGVRILATSQAFLGIPDEQHLPVPPMSLPDPDDRDSKPLAPFEALDLLVARGVQQKPDFVVTKDNYAAAVTLCQKLDGHPLAIELAASRLGALSVQEILTRLDDPLRLSRVGQAVGRKSHHSLADVVAWTASLCSDPELRLWASLSAFPGCFDIEAAEHIASCEKFPAENILPVLERLVRQSVITADTSTGTTRYHLLETLRTYGLQKLRELGYDAIVRERHMNYYQELACQAAAEYYGPDELGWLRRLKADLPNLRSGLRYCESEPGYQLAGLEFAASLAVARCWFFFGTLSEGRMWLRRMYARNPEHSTLRACALAADAFLAVCQGDHLAADVLLAEARVTVEACQDWDPQVAVAIAALRFAEGARAWLRGLRESVELLRQARDMFLALGQRGDAYMAKLLLCLAASQLGDDAEFAMAAADDLLADTAEHEAGWSITWSHYAFGLAHLYHGDLGVALTWLRQALAAQREIGDQWGPVWDLLAIAECAARSGDLTTAAVLHGSIEKIIEYPGVALHLMTPFWAAHLRIERAATEALGPETFADLHDKGEKLGWDASLLFGLGRPPETGQESAVDVPDPVASLSPREREVAFLVAEGLTNQQIADRLVIGVRTVDTHVLRVLRKLGVDSRVLITARLAGHGQS